MAEEVPTRRTVPHPSGHAPDAMLRHRHRRWLAVVGVGAAIALLTALFGFGLGSDPTTLRSALVGRAAPDFELRTLDGRSSVRLSELRGQVVVINFWASWCRECRVEHPALAAAWTRFRDRGVVFLGIPFQDTLPASLAYARDVGGGWPLLSDPSAGAALAFGVYGVPETFFVDARGRVADKHVGPVSYELLADQVTRLLRERSP